MNTVIKPLEQWKSIPEALNALETARQMECPIATILHKLYACVAKANGGTTFLVQVVIKEKRIETPVEISQRLWHRGCELNINGMGQARRDLTELGLDPLTEEERAERQRLYLEHKAKLKEERKAQKAKAKEKRATARQAAIAANPPPPPPGRMSEKEWEEWHALERGSPAHEAVVLELAFGSLKPPLTFDKPKGKTKVMTTKQAAS